MIVKNYNPLNKIGIPESTLVYVNKWTDTWEGEKTLPWCKMLNNKSKRNVGMRKSLFGHHHSNNSFRQKTSMDIKITRWKWDEEWDFTWSQSYLLKRYLLTTEEKTKSLYSGEIRQTPSIKWSNTTKHIVLMCYQV